MSESVGRAWALVVVAASAIACDAELGADGGSSGEESGSGNLPGDGNIFEGGDVSGDGDVLGDGDGFVGDGDAVVPDDASCGEVGVNVGAGVLRRLSRVEYQLTLQDMLKLPAPPSIELIPEDVEDEGFTTFSELQSVTAQHLRGYLDTAGALLDDLSADTARFDGVVGCDPTDAGCLRDFVARFGRLAYRRSLSTEEVDALVAAASEHGQDEEDQIKYAAEALLVSPHFLFRVEVGDQPEGLSSLSSEELASKLSFTLWGRGPSAALLDRAASGELDTPEGLAVVAREMLEDPKAETYFREFFRQWIGYGKLRTPIEPPADWSDDLMPDMVTETDTLIEQYAWVPGQNLWDILTASHTTVSAAVASFYGVSTDSSGIAQFAPGDPRHGAGILGQASVLSQKTDGDKVSVRGNWLRGTFLCEELHVPADLAETIGDQLVGLTSMEIIAERNTTAGCMNCHSAIDPIGVGLAQFDATGRFDESVDLASYPVEPLFPDAEDPAFGSVGELAAKLRELPQINECLTEKAFIYALGRHTAGGDACAAERATSGFVGEGGSFASLIFNLVVSDGFRLRRAPASSM